MGVQKIRQKVLAAGGAQSLEPIELQSYTQAELVADTPDPANYTGALVFCSDNSTGGPCPCYSDGTDWLRVNDLAAPD